MRNSRKLYHKCDMHRNTHAHERGDYNSSTHFMQRAKNENMLKLYSHFEFGAFECAYLLQVTSNCGDKKGQNFALIPTLGIIWLKVIDKGSFYFG